MLTIVGRLEGRDAYGAGWRDFADAWKETDHTVQLSRFGKSTVVTYLFSITFAIGTQKQTLQSGTYSSL